MCGITRNLMRISKEKRYEIAVKENVFIPVNSVVCCYHTEIDSWINVATFIQPNYSDFTKELVEDMFQLLSKPPLMSGTSKESSL